VGQSQSVCIAAPIVSVVCVCVVTTAYLCWLFFRIARMLKFVVFTAFAISFSIAGEYCGISDSLLSILSCRNAGFQHRTFG